MDATSASGNGFDAALKALEDLEADAADDGAGKPAQPAPAAKPIGAIGFSDVESEGEPAAIAAVPLAEIEMPVPEPVREPPSDPSAPAAAAAAPLAVPAATAPGRMGRLAVGLAVVSSILSAAGLIVAERTIVSAQLVVADARERQRQLELANKLIRDLEIVRAKQIELLQAQQAQLASAPVTSAELQHKMDMLQAGLVARDPLDKVVAVLRAGHSDNAARFNELGMKLARVERALENR